MRRSRRACGCAALTCLWLGALGAQAQDDEPDLGWIDQEALAAGEVVMRTRKPAPLMVGVDLAVLIDAPPQDVWAVLTSCEIAPEYVPHVLDCTRIETAPDGRSELFLQTIKPIFFVPRFEHVFRLSYEPYRRIDVSHVSGFMAHLAGTWWLLERGQGLLLVHELELDPGIPIPRFLVRTRLRRDLPRVLAAVRDSVEAGP